MRLRKAPLLVSALALFLALAALVQACSPGRDAKQDDLAGSGGAPPTGAGLGGTLFDADIGDGALTEDGACAVIKKDGKAVPVTLYVMMDKSSSMQGPKWTAAVAGIGTFVDDPESAGIEVGLKLFPRDADAVPACDQAAYKTPLVDFGPLPDNAPAIKAALAAESPDGFSTPIYPALGGAILAGIEVAKNDEGRAAAVLLVTDGLPQGPAPICSGVNPENPAVIADLAQTGADYDPPVKTFVVGLPGVDQSFANQIAAAGGTDEAILVSADNVEVEFAEALAKVAGEALPCEYEIPEEVGGEIATDRVNVAFTPSGTEGVMLPQDPSCAGEGWYYDDPAAPTKIILCPESCAAAKEDLEAKIEILLGCKTVVAN
jgi:hypothetical protein